MRGFFSLQLLCFHVGPMILGSEFTPIGNTCRSISHFSTLLEKDDRALRMAAGEAVALIFEIGQLVKFRNDETNSGDEINKPTEGYIQIQGLRGKITNQVRDLSTEAGGKGSAKKDLNSQRNLFRDVLEFLEVVSDFFPPNKSLNIEN